MTVARIWTSAGWMDLNGAPGLPGPQGPPGGPVPVGGTTDQVLAKASNTDGHVKWVDAGGGAAAVWIDEEAPSDPEANLWIDTDEPGVDLQDWAGLDTRVDTLETIPAAVCHQSSCLLRMLVKRFSTGLLLIRACGICATRRAGVTVMAGSSSAGHR